MTGELVHDDLSASADQTNRRREAGKTGPNDMDGPARHHTKP
jgi:hypothetical protein